MLKFFFKKIKYYIGRLLSNCVKTKTHQIILILLIVAGSFLVGDFALAGWWDTTVIGVLGTIATVIIKVLGWIVSLGIEGVLQIGQYNNFINEPTIVEGWILVRDLCNMFFILILLIIAFGTILKIETYGAKQLLGKLLLMAILINFSRMICGLFIDFSQVIMLTFVDAFTDGGGNFVKGLQMDKFLSATRVVSDKDTGLLNVVAGMFMAIFFMVVAAIVMWVLLAVLVMRVVMLWVYIVLSPLAFLLAAFPAGKSYATQWWGDFSKNVIVGPVLAFFIWLALSAAGSGGGFMGLDIGASLKDEGLCIGPSDILCAGSFMNYIIAVAMLFGGLVVTQQIGGVTATIAGKGLAWSKVAGKKMGGWAVSPVTQPAKRIGYNIAEKGLSTVGGTLPGVLGGTAMLKAGMKLSAQRVHKEEEEKRYLQYAKTGDLTAIQKHSKGLLRGMAEKDGRKPFAKRVLTGLAGVTDQFKWESTESDFRGTTEELVKRNDIDPDLDKGKKETTQLLKDFFIAHNGNFTEDGKLDFGGDEKALKTWNDFVKLNVGRIQEEDITDERGNTIEGINRFLKENGGKDKEGYNYEKSDYWKGSYNEGSKRAELGAENARRIAAGRTEISEIDIKEEAAKYKGFIKGLVQYTAVNANEPVFRAWNDKNLTNRILNYVSSGGGKNPLKIIDRNDLEGRADPSVRKRASEWRASIYSENAEGGLEGHIDPVLKRGSASVLDGVGATAAGVGPSPRPLESRMGSTDIRTGVGGLGTEEVDLSASAQAILASGLPVDTSTLEALGVNSTQAESYLKLDDSNRGDVVKQIGALLKSRGADENYIKEVQSNIQKSDHIVLRNQDAGGEEKESADAVAASRGKLHRYYNETERQEMFERMSPEERENAINSTKISLLQPGMSDIEARDEYLARSMASKSEYSKRGIVGRMKTEDREAMFNKMVSEGDRTKELQGIKNALGKPDMTNEDARDEYLVRKGKFKYKTGLSEQVTSAGSNAVAIATSKRRLLRDFKEESERESMFESIGTEEERKAALKRTKEIVGEPGMGDEQARDEFFARSIATNKGYKTGLSKEEASKGSEVIRKSLEEKYQKTTLTDKEKESSINKFMNVDEFMQVSESEIKQAGGITGIGVGGKLNLDKLKNKKRVAVNLEELGYDPNIAGLNFTDPAAIAGIAAKIANLLRVKGVAEQEAKNVQAAIQGMDSFTLHNRGAEEDLSEGERRKIISHETGHDRIDNNVPASELVRMFNKLPEGIREAMEKKIRLQWNDGKMEQPAIAKEYFAEGLMNKTKWHDKGPDPITLHPNAERSLEAYLKGKGTNISNLTSGIAPAAITKAGMEGRDISGQIVKLMQQGDPVLAKSIDQLSKALVNAGGDGVNNLEDVASRIGYSIDPLVRALNEQAPLLGRLDARLFQNTLAMQKMTGEKA